MNKALVTGNLGFIGHHLARRLREDGWHVIGIDNCFAGEREWTKYCHEFFEENIEGLNHLPDVDGIFHLAAKPRVPYSIEHPLQTHETNTTATLVLLELASRMPKPPVFIYSSSSSVYGNQTEMPLVETMTPAPLSPYAAQKLMGEYYCGIYSALKGVPTISLRYFNVYGKEQPADHPYAPVITKFLKRAADGKFLTIYGDGEQRRDFTHVDDVVEANLAAYQTLCTTLDIAGSVYNIGRGHNISVRRLATLIDGCRGHIAYEAARPGDVYKTLADVTRATSELGWVPHRSVEDWIREQP